MKIEQKKEFKPLVITIENEYEYGLFFQIIDEAVSVKRENAKFITIDARSLAGQLSEFATNNTL